jgi:hypothetical protein
MGSVELVVLIVALLVGLIIGGLLPWATLLLGTGHGERRLASETSSSPPPQREGERNAGRAMLGALLAIATAVLAALLMVPGSVRGLPSIDEVPGGAFTLSFAVLIVAVVFALPRWLGVRR